MPKPVYFTTPGGEDLVMLSRADYDDLIAQLASAAEERANPSLEAALSVARMLGMKLTIEPLPSPSSDPSAAT